MENISNSYFEILCLQIFFKKGLKQIANIAETFDILKKEKMYDCFHLNL